MEVGRPVGIPKFDIDQPVGIPKFDDVGGCY